MNEAANNHDFEAAVIQLRQGQRKAWIKFGAFTLLIAIFVLGIVGFSFSVSSTVKEMVGDQSHFSSMPEVDVP